MMAAPAKKHTMPRNIRVLRADESSETMDVGEDLEGLRDML